MSEQLLPEDAVRARLMQALKERNVTVITIAGEDVNLRQRLYTQIMYNKKLSVEALLVFLQYFPDLSAEWLLRGEGSMFFEGRQSQQPEVSERAKPIEISLENLANRVSRLEAEVFKI